MTTAKFSESDNKFSAHIEGHAGYSHCGPDIVCSACSILAYTMLQSILSTGGECIKELSYGDDPDNGTFMLDIVAPSEGEAEKIRTIYKVIASGFALLADQYPQNVNLCVNLQGN